MKKIFKRLLTGLCALVGIVTAGVAVCTFPTSIDNTTAQAATTYTTKDVGMMAYIEDVYAANGNFYLYITMSELDTTTQAKGVAVDTSKGDMPTILGNFDFYNKVKINGYTLAELGCTGVWENAFDVNSGGGAPLYKFRFHMHADPTTWNNAIDDGKVVFGVGSNVTISEGALVPGYNYLTGDHTATVYRAGCDFVSSASDVAYGIMSVGKTEVESVEYVQGHDGNCGYFGFSLKGDDYLGNGTQLEVNQNYSYDNKYYTTILVNGESGKTGSYGLFNLGQKGKGYFSFAMYATAEEMQTITIPAGTKFPARAMTDLPSTNSNNKVTIMYETQTDVTFYKQADGSWAKPYVEKETSVSSAYVDSDGGSSFTVLFLSNHDYATELDNYGGTAVKVKEFLARSNFYTNVLIDDVALGDTGEAYVNVWGNKGSIAFRTSQGVNATKITVLAGCEIPSYAELLSGERIKYVTTEDITFVKNANGEWVEASGLEEELNALREAALAELNAYVALDNYFDEQKAELNNYLAAAQNELAADASEVEIAATVEAVKANLDSVLTKAQVVANAKAEIENYKAAEGYFQAEEAEKRAQYVAQAKTEIDNATSQAAVNAAVANAKAAIDKLVTAAEIYVTKDVAMLARIGGWYGNGNFTLKITLGEADWTNEDAGTKTYNGDLATLLNKLGLFDHIMVGGKTLAEWGCVACYDNGYELNEGEPNNIILLHLSMGAENMAAATAAGVKADAAVTMMEGALVPSYAYLKGTGNTVYHAGADYVSTISTVPHGIESVAKTTVESVKYVQSYTEKDGVGYFGVSLVGDDYLGDGTQLEVNSNYNFNTFVNSILVNGEAGKVKYYGLFNLGEKGQGYYAFQILVAEEDIEYITIPAGTLFPSRAMTTLRELNGNPVYIMYEVEETVILYKSANGYVSYIEAALSAVENYKVGLFRAEEEAQRAAIVAQAVETINSALDNATIDTAVANAKAAIDLLKTAAQYADEENAALVEAKNAAIAELTAYKANGLYLDEQAAERLAVIENATTEISGVIDTDSIAAIVADAKAAIDQIVEKTAIISAAKAEVAGYKAGVAYAAEQAAQKDAIIAEAQEIIDNATSQAAINAAVANAKAAIDKLFTAAEIYVTKDVAMLARIGGWYGNGNFTLNITLGEADWTNDDAGEKAYDGDLTTLLNKLGLFDHIMVGGKTLAEWGCVACYDNSYELNAGEPDNIILLHLAMGKENMDVATAAGVGAGVPVTMLEGALVPSYAYLKGTGNTVYHAGADYVSTISTVPHGIESVAKTTVESVKYVQSYTEKDGVGYFGVSLVVDDYLGDGTQLEVNTNYKFNSFVNSILVNGEAGKVRYYGLFNLGEKGQGYYAFQILVAEEDIEYITIPAGTLFPSRAMTTLPGINNNNLVYIMYEVEETVILYKSANGYVSYIEAALSEVENYKVGLFRAEEEAQRVEIVAQAVETINSALDNATIDTAVANAKAAIDALKTAAQYADEENAALVEAKNAAIAELTAYKANGLYLDEQAAERLAVIENATTEISGVIDTDSIAAIVADAKAAIDQIVEKTAIISAAKAEVAGYKAGVAYAAEQAAQKDAIIAEAQEIIDNATSQAAINAAVANAKAAIDKLVTAAEIYVTKDVAMLARIGGWYGNGNFTLKITLGEADWTNDDAGAKEYDGDLATLLNKLGLFDHIMVGGKTLAEWGCVACYDNSYELNAGEPDNIIMLHLAMSKENMDAATAEGVGADAPVTMLEGALVPSYAYLKGTGNTVYHAGADYVSSKSTYAYNIQSIGKTTVDGVKYVQSYEDGIGYFGVSLVGDDYLGDGTQLEVNQDYYFDSFVGTLLVNGELDLVKYYGLFNLGEAGVGYYAFQILVPEEEIETITIPAGTLFPTRAMTPLFELNGNPVYIMYEVEADITFYNTEDGFMTYGECAAAELGSYKAGAFRAEEEAQRLAIVEQAIIELQAAQGNAAVDAVIDAAKAAIDVLKTAAQYADEELADVKAAAVATIEAYKADVVYLAEQVADRAAAVDAGKAAIANAASEEAIEEAIASAKAAIDALSDKATIISAAKAEVEAYKADVVYADEQAAARLAVIETAKAAIDNATSQAAINAAVANAKAAIDEIKTKDQLAAESLAAKKAAANTAVDILKGGVDYDLYSEDAVETINGLYSTVKAAIASAETEADVDAAVADFEAALANVPQKDAGSSSDATQSGSDSESSNGGALVFGCGSVSGLASGMLMLGVAVVALFKKKEN